MLKLRVLTGVFGVLLIIAVTAWGYEPFRLLVWFGTLFGVAEFSSMLGFRFRSWMSLLMSILVSYLQWYPNWHLHAVGVFEISIALTLVLPVLFKNKITLTQTATLLVGGFYIGFGGYCLARLRAFDHGWNWLWLFLISIWMTDTAAYFIGRWLKGPKLWPSISPSKTISGALGGLLGAVVGAVIFELFAEPRFDMVGCALFALIVSVAGQLGDLVESAYKRSAGVKDSGKVLPGHGGILDRIDSLVFAAPFAFEFIHIGLLRFPSIL